MALFGIPSARPAEPLGELDDIQLVERVRTGDGTAYDRLVERHMRRAFSIAYRLLGHREDAEDLVQDAFLQALERIDSFDTSRSFGPWFYRILVNRGLNQRKARSVRQAELLPLDLASGDPLPDRAAEQTELRARLRAALDELPEKQRVAVQLFEIEGFSGSEIAEILGIPAGTVRYHLHQARHTLRDALEVYCQRNEP
jgi:RNA polymerase sigma-70 factor, ECF subfamily